MSRDVVVTSENVGFLQNVSIGRHRFLADEPFEAGGCDAGPNPYELLLTALGACTAMTIRMYANRKQWPLEAVRVRLTHEKIHAEDCLACETKEGLVERIEREILLRGDLTDEQRQKLLEIANKCPVHRTLTSEIRIETRLLDVPLVRANDRGASVQHRGRERCNRLAIRKPQKGRGSEHQNRDGCLPIDER